jgi:hypothetical protein
MGNTSRMFKSDIFLTTQVAKTDKFAGFRCYVYDKSLKKVTIDATPTARTITCTTLGTEMIAQTPLVGKLTCPSVDWSYNTEFCSNRNGCNNKGWCSKQSLSCNCFDSGVTGDCNCDTEKKKYYDVD